MRAVKIQTDQPGRGLRVVKQSSKVSILHTPSGREIVLWEGYPLAIFDSGTLYSHTSAVGVKITALRKLYTHAAEMAFSTTDFEFVLGQALSQAGLGLVRKPE